MTTYSTRRRIPPLAVEAPQGRPTAYWGMVLFVASEGTFFACMLAAYFYIRFSVDGGAWPPDGISNPKLTKPLIETALMVPSSLPMLWASAGIKRGRVGRQTAGLALTLVLGLAFFAVQSLEYIDDLSEYSPQTNAYGSLFYLITGFHDLHILVGLTMLIVMLIATLRGKFTAARHERVRLVNIYWQFVVVVWVAVLVCLYLSPYLGA